MLPPEIHSEHFSLKPYQKKDEDEFIKMALDELSIQFMGGASGIEAEERALFNSVFKLYEKNEKRWFWIWGIYKEDNLCGHFELKETEHTSKNELEIVYMIHPDFRRQGIMKNIFSFLKKYQHEIGKRIIATVSPKNTFSLSLLQSWGIDKKEILKDDETGKEYLKLLLSQPNTE